MSVDRLAGVLRARRNVTARTRTVSGGALVQRRWRDRMLGPRGRPSAGGRFQIGDHGKKGVVQFVIRTTGCGGGRSDKVQVVRAQESGFGPNDGAEAPAHPVPGHRVTDGAPDGVRNPRRAGTCRDRARHRQYPSTTAPARGQRPKGRAITDVPDQADRRSRPFDRRRRSTACPARSDIRCRKPCFFLRLRLFGWKVLFTHASSNARAEEKGLGAARSRPAGGFGRMQARKRTWQCTARRGHRQSARRGCGRCSPGPQNHSPRTPAGSLLRCPQRW